MSKSDENWMKKCMKPRVEGRRPVGRPRRTSLESVDAGMAQLEIDREDVHDRKKGRNNVMRLQTTQPTSGGAVTVDSSYCANCVEPPRPQHWGPDLPFFWHAGHADPLDGWCCCSQKRVMSRPIQVRQL